MTIRIPPRINLIPVQRLVWCFFKQFIAEHHTQHCAAHLIKILHIDTSILCGLYHLLIIISITTVCSNTGSQSLVSSFYFIFSRIMLTGSQVTYSTAVTNYETAESPFLTQNIMQQFSTFRYRNTQKIRICHHQRLAIIVTNHMTERNQMYFAHFTFRQSYIMRIASSQRSTMTTKMFRSSIQPHRLVAFNPSSTNLRYQNRILSKCFLTTSPTGILSYIQYRRPCLHSTCRKSFIANCHCHFFCQLLIPSCPHCKSLGKDSSSTTI